MADTLPTIDEIEAMIPAIEALEELIDEGCPSHEEFNCGACYFCDRQRGHETYCPWRKAEEALRKWKGVRGE